MGKRANSARGEAQIITADQEYILRPSYEALASAEGEIGSLFDFVERAAAGKALYSEVVALFWHCAILPAHSSNRSDADERTLFSDNMASIGLAGLTPALKIILRQILQGL